MSEFWQNTKAAVGCILTSGWPLGAGYWMSRRKAEQAKKEQEEAEGRGR